MPLLKSTAPQFLGTHSVVATQPDEPADVYYENLGISRLERMARRLGVEVRSVHITTLQSCVCLRASAREFWTSIRRQETQVTICGIKCYEHDVAHQYLHELFMCTRHYVKNI